MASDTLSVTVQDTIAPGISADRSPLPNANGWNNTDVTASFACTDAISGVAAGPQTPQTLTAQGTVTANASCTDRAGWISTIDMLDLMTMVFTLTAELTVMAFSLWLLFRMLRE